MTIETEVLVIGSGPGGYVAAIRSAQLGKEVLLVEEEKQLGGVCLHAGCIPSKALIHASDFYEKIHHMADMGIEIKDYKVDIKKMIAWKDGIREKLDAGIKGLFKKYGIEVITGKAIFKSDSEVRIEGKTDISVIKFKQAIIATGSVPLEVSGFPFSSKYVMSSKEALSLQEIPKKLIIIGGGYIGTEMGTVYGKLGTEVHIVEMLDRLIPAFDREVVEVVARKLSSFKVNLHLSTKALGMKEKEGKAAVEIEEKGKKIILEADKVLVVVGRKPNSKGIGLENTSVKTDDKGFIKVDQQMRAAKNIFAIGDVVGQPMLAHKASREAKVAAEVIAGKPSAFDNKVIPFIVFNDPELISAGLTEEDARAKGKDIVIGRFPFAALGKAMTLQQTDGFVKIIADKNSKVVLGVQAVGPNVSELVSEAALAIEMGATLEDIALTIHPHPTIGESLMECAEAALGEAIHIFSPKKKE